jgi:hypothetical protein
MTQRSALERTAALLSRLVLLPGGDRGGGAFAAQVILYIYIHIYI